MDCAEVASPQPVDLLRDEAEPGAPGLSTLTLQIEAFEQKDGASHYCLAALAGERRVGFSLELRCSDRDPLPIPEHDVELSRCEVILKSTGEESDRFVAAVAAVYDLDVGRMRGGRRGHMPDELEFHALCLAGEPGRPQLGPLQLLLLYSGSEPARRSDVMKGDFEWFLRIDLTQGEAAFVDRAPEHHASIVAALSGGLSWRH
ncbi:MAG TPA: hypothetical protein VGB85_27935 [Nannocystis sp.]